MGRETGVLCHLTSLPTGKISDSDRFLDFLKGNGYSKWQFLPLTPPDEHNSPYASPSAFAGHHGICSSDIVGDLSDEDYWLEDWALFATITEHYPGKNWTEWPDELRNRDPSALTKWRERINPEIVRQGIFQHEWLTMKDRANYIGIDLIGDLPIFISHHSADVWANPELFQLDENGLPVVVAGVPPDYFSETGQKWNTVLYNWDEHEKSNWLWWRERMARMLRLFDIVRIDHFRGFHSAWAVPREAEDGVIGQWQSAPKDKIIKALVDVAGDESRIIAEDLGIIPQEVIDLRLQFNLRGMAILQFGFGEDAGDSPHHPHNINSMQVVYTGTHDNDTTLGWWQTLDDTAKANVRQLTGQSTDVVGSMIELAKQCPAPLCIIPLQDILRLDSTGRMNVPGVEQGNWQWRFQWENLSFQGLSIQRQYDNPPNLRQHRMGLVGYFTAEIGLWSELHTYSGGLGVLAGDHVKSAADAEIDLVGVTLLYREGYGRQHIDNDGNQTETFGAIDPADHLIDTGLDLTLPLDDGTIHAKIWKVEVVGVTGHVVPVYFMDTHHPKNSEYHQRLGARLYGGDDDVRIRQEYLLGVGGVRLLNKLKKNFSGLHLNEGHCTFALLELLSQGWTREDLSKKILFTTHTPVPAGHDRFEWDDVNEVLGDLMPEDAVELVKSVGDPEDGARCSMSHLAVALAEQVNAVSNLNAQVASTMFDNYHIHPLTNGVHHITWTSPTMSALFDEKLPGWKVDPTQLGYAGTLSDDDLLAARGKNRRIFRELVKASTGVELEEERLTIGFARRFATYKRANLVFKNLERLSRIGGGKIQFVFSGKAHPRDDGGKQLIRDIYGSAKHLEQEIPVAFLENYDMDTGLAITSGVDIWLNNPVRPMEASGTSGMKAAMNGVPNCSILDGWWPEGCQHGVNGWAIGESEDDRNDDRDADNIYSVLENDVIPAWEKGGSVWANIMRSSIATSARFTGARMISEYKRFYDAFE